MLLQVNTMEEPEEIIKSKILRLLVLKRKWLHSHTPLVNVVKWVYVKHNGKMIRKMIHELRREGMIMIKPTHYGEEISLNPNKKEEIIKLVKKYFPEPVSTR